jgi:hypothetical protein
LALNILFPDAEKELFRQAVLLHSRSLSTQRLVDVARNDALSNMAGQSWQRDPLK